MSSARYLGIDLGTTNSAAAVFDGEQVHLVRTASGGLLTPSIVRFDSRGGVTVGTRARRFLESDPTNTRSEFKRLMGTTHSLSFPAAKVEKSPTELSALILGSIRRDVQDQFGFSPVKAVVTVPALFELPQSTATSEAARLAGFEQIEMLQEPVASAIAAGWTAKDADARPWLVYDLGGGTFDVSLLETQEGLLRVVGHDGDNFLGGRDFDSAIIDHVLERLAEDSWVIDVADSTNAAGMRRLRYACEEAKIELSRTDRAVISLPGAFVLGAEPVDIDLEIEREEMLKRVSPLVDRSAAVCLRLLERHGVKLGEVGKIVLVGGPTMIPALRERISALLQAPLAPGLDPMTLVAQGAALFAASAGLSSQAKPAAAPGAGVQLWLQYPSMTADPTPFLVGKQLGTRCLDVVRVSRPDWTSTWEAVGEDGTFLVPLDLAPRSSNTFAVEGRAGITVVAVSPPDFTVVHGVTLQDPPLSRTVGIALADDSVHVYFPRGAPLPIRRTFTLSIVETLIAGDPDQALRVPIVQGEFHRARLCRLVGTLEVPAGALTQNLTVGTEIEIELEMDRGGRLAAKAKLPSGQVFDDVAQLVAPNLSPAAMVDLAAGILVRVARARSGLSERLNSGMLSAATEAERLVQEAQVLLRLARGGDADAAEKARRCILEADGHASTVEAAAAWPEMARELEEIEDNARVWVGRFGSTADQAALDNALKRARAALAGHKEAELGRLKGTIEALTDTAWRRSPGAWGRAFDHWRSRASEARDGRAAAEIVRRGEAAKLAGDNAALERCCNELYNLLPADAEERRRAFGSGVR